MSCTRDRTDGLIKYPSLRATRYRQVAGPSACPCGSMSTSLAILRMESAVHRVFPQSKPSRSHHPPQSPDAVDLSQRSRRSSPCRWSREHCGRWERVPRPSRSSIHGSRSETTRRTGSSTMSQWHCRHELPIFDLIKRSATPNYCIGHRRCCSKTPRQSTWAARVRSNARLVHLVA